MDCAGWLKVEDMAGWSRSNPLTLTQIIFALIGFALTVALAMLSYFIKGLNQKFDALGRTVDRHNDEDDNRFKDLQRVVDDVRKDIVDKRHAFRGEMRDAFTSVSDRAEKTENRLRSEIARVEGLITK